MYREDRCECRTASIHTRAPLGDEECDLHYAKPRGWLAEAWEECPGFVVVGAIALCLCVAAVVSRIIGWHF